MKRRLFNAGAVVSLVLFSLGAGLWCIGRWWPCAVVYRERGRVVGVSLDVEAIYWIEGQAAPAIPPPKLGWALERHEKRRIYFRHPSGGSVVTTGYRNLAEPKVNLWLLALPFAWLLVWLSPQTRFPTCPSCGYDLRGNPGSKTCRECGVERVA